jgi:hypothetical protein
MKQGQQGTTAVPAGSCALTLTSGKGSEQQRSPGHAVYGMQGVSESGFGGSMISPEQTEASKKRGKPITAIARFLSCS